MKNSITEGSAEGSSSSPRPEGVRDGDYIAETFKNASGSWLLKALFLEITTDPDKTKVLYTLKPQDHTYKGRTFPSLRRLYLEEGDDTEYYFAEKYFGGWPHWKRLLNCNWFVDYISEIREELAAKQEADAKRNIRKKATEGGVGANKILLDELKRSSSPVGRPTKESIRRQAEELFQDQSELQDDLDRITSSIGSFRSQ